MKKKFYLLITEDSNGFLTTKKIVLNDIIEKYSSHISQGEAFVVDGHIVPFNQLKKKYRERKSA